MCWYHQWGHRLRGLQRRINNYCRGMSPGSLPPHVVVTSPSAIPSSQFLVWLPPITVSHGFNNRGHISVRVKCKYGRVNAGSGVIVGHHAQVIVNNWMVIVTTSSSVRRPIFKFGVSSASSRSRQFSPYQRRHQSVQVITTPSSSPVTGLALTREGPEQSVQHAYRRG